MESKSAGRYQVHQGEHTLKRYLKVHEESVFHVQYALKPHRRTSRCTDPITISRPFLSLVEPSENRDHVTEHSPPMNRR